MVRLWTEKDTIGQRPNTRIENCTRTRSESAVQQMNTSEDSTIRARQNFRDEAEIGSKVGKASLVWTAA